MTIISKLCYRLKKSPMTYKQMQNFTYYQSKKGQGIDNPRKAPQGWYSTNFTQLKYKGIIAQNEEGLYYLTALGDKYKNKKPYSRHTSLEPRYGQLKEKYNNIYSEYWHYRKEYLKLYEDNEKQLELLTKYRNRHLKLVRAMSSLFDFAYPDDELCGGNDWQQSEPHPWFKDFGLLGSTKAKGGQND